MCSDILYWTLVISIMCYLPQVQRAEKCLQLVYVDKECLTNFDEISANISAHLNLNNSFHISQCCDDDSSKLETLFLNKSIDILIGALDFEYETLITKYSEFYDKPLLTPYGRSQHIINNNKHISSIGATFESLATAMRLVLTHFRWGNVAVIVEMDDYHVSLSSVVFIELSESGFKPQVSYIRDSGDADDINAAIENIGAHQKGMLLYYHQFVCRNAIRLFALQLLQFIRLLYYNC